MFRIRRGFGLRFFFVLFLFFVIVFAAERSEVDVVAEHFFDDRAPDIERGADRS